MSGIPLPDRESASDSEWIRSVVRNIDADEETVRALLSAYSEAFQPSAPEKEAALKDLLTSVYFKTSETPYDNSPRGYVWVQFPYEGELAAHYEYYCENPPHPAPAQMDVASGRNWTYVTHTVTRVDSRVREAMRDIGHFQVDGDDTSLDSTFSDDQITIVRSVRDPDFRTTKEILTEGFGLDFSEIYDAWGHFKSEWHEARVYWNE